MKYLKLILLFIIWVSTITFAQNVSNNSFDATRILNMLQEGGYTVYVRHTHTDRFQTDTDLSDCTKQRNLSDQGRSEARAIGEVFNQLELSVSRLISTQLCRTKETAELAFGEPEVIARSELFSQLEVLLSTFPAEASNVFIVAHIGMLDGATGLNVGTDIMFNEGDALLFKPLPEAKYEVAGYIALNDWPELLKVKLEASP